MSAEQHGQCGSHITCPRCGVTSQHPMDVAHRYCGNCHMFHEHMDADAAPARPGPSGPELEAQLFSAAICRDRAGWMLVLRDVRSRALYRAFGLATMDEAIEKLNEWRKGVIIV